jgi:colanic acid/amylovoran biosynthesis glycosyltransferase
MTLTLVGAPAERGGADIQQQLQAMVRAHSAEAHVDIRGPVEFRDLHCLMADFDVFIHPSCYTANRDSEGAGAVALLDAQATGLPVISTLHCDIPENVVHERTGLLTPETDSDALAESIQRFYAMDEAEYRTFAERARAHVVENYRLTDSAQRLRAIYERFAS